MTLTRFSDYSLRVLMFAAVRGNQPFSVAEVAVRYELSKNHLAKVVNRLVRLGHLKARRGRYGGVWLGRDPKDICLGKLVRLTESEIPLVECFGRSNQCRLSPACRLKGALAEALESFYRCLDRYTLADLVASSKPLAALLEGAR